ncbi:MAG TPA: SDR family NAD(P)-dependent oxidoreductase, partial [Rhodopila sp.]|nr:SDR family NAD(P)-dependent oxidoreductase [Rhodopila sp.]
MELQGKTALITGGTSGIGLATAKLFVREGARVAVIGRDASRFDAIRADLGGDALILAADVRSITAMQSVARSVGETFGSLDILFANAGIAYATPLA